MAWASDQPGYPNIFDASNCSLISQLLPAGPKQFLADFMAGNAFRNPIQQVAGLLQGKLGDNIGKIEGLGSTIEGLGELNAALKSVNNELSALVAHTNRLSGVSTDDILPRLDQMLGVMSAYNSIKDLLKNGDELLEDNFSNAFSSLNPQIIGPFFENFGQNMNSISSLLANIENQLAQGGLTDAAALVGQIRQLTNNITAIESNINTLIENDNLAFALALAAVERYALGNSIISTALTDPCFGAQLLKNLILNPDFSQGLDGIAQQNGVKIEGSPVNLVDHVPSVQ
jgi:hypothetical protein